MPSVFTINNEREEEECNEILTQEAETYRALQLKC